MTVATIALTILMSTISASLMSSQKTPYSLARSIAKRLLSIGINPFQSQAHRYVVLLGSGAGEIVDWGPQLRGSRYFGPNAIRKDRPMVADFEAFAKADGLKDCVFWCIGVSRAKASPESLDAALKSFNEKINIEFSELRKSGKFEQLLLVVHPRYDHESGLFDLHAHFIARIPREHREAIRLRLGVKFSKTDFPDQSIRNAAAVATYMLWGIFRNKIMIHWPDNALRAAWKLTESRFHFVRPGGSFSQWRAAKARLKEKACWTVDEAKKHRNRAATADPRQQVVNGDRLLSKIMLKIRGVRTPALLFEAAPSSQASQVIPCGQQERVYSSATNIAAQEPTGNRSPTGLRKPSEATNAAWSAFQKRLRDVRKQVSFLRSKIFEIGKALVRKLTC